MSNIILIDDDDAAHTYHKVMIEEAGIDVNRVVSFFGVDDAMQYISVLAEGNNKDLWPDYIFIDINMPIKSGFDFIEEFKSLKLTTNVPIIYFVSSTKNPYDLQRINEIDLIKGFETKFLEKEFFEGLMSA